LDGRRAPPPPQNWGRTLDGRRVPPSPNKIIINM